MNFGDVAAFLFLGAAVYEAVAVWFEKVPTITKVLNDRPRLFRAALLGGAVAWGVFHFEVV